MGLDNYYRAVAHDLRYLLRSAALTLEQHHLAASPKNRTAALPMSLVPTPKIQRRST